MDHPTWVPASASSAGGASASANQEWREQLEALVHWTEEDLSAKEIEELKLIKDMVTSEEQGSFLAYENDTVPAHASALIQIDSDEEVARRLQERLDGVVPPGPPPQHGRRAALQCATGLPLFPCRAAGQPAKRQRTSGASPSPELSVAKIKEAFGRAAPDGLLDVGLVNTLMRHFRMKFCAGAGGQGQRGRRERPPPRLPRVPVADGWEDDGHGAGQPRLLSVRLRQAVAHEPAGESGPPPAGRPE